MRIMVLALLLGTSPVRTPDGRVVKPTAPLRFPSDGGVTVRRGGGQIEPKSVGTPGNWRGCRGSGLQVCAELANDAYFAAHRECTPNPACGGMYFICNERCPRPTEKEVGSQAAPDAPK